MEHSFKLFTSFQALIYDNIHITEKINKLKYSA